MDPELDDSIGRLIRASQSSSAPADGSAACLDAETLAAWTDGGLPKAARAAAEQHLAGCARCQQMLAVLARTTPAGAVPSTWADRARNWRWLAPITAAAAAAVLWIAVQDDARPAPMAPTATSIAEKQDKPADLVLSEPTAADAVKPLAKEQERVGAASDRAARRSDADAREERALAAAPAENDRFAALDQKATSSQTTAPSSAPAAAASAPSETTATRAEAPPPSVAGSANEAVALFRQAVQASNVVFSPDAAIGWQFGASGSIQQTKNGGTTWQAVPSGVTADLTGGSAPSPTVCWLVGRAGTVLLSTDGGRFEQLPSPAAVDLVGVRATDARTAIVTTADRRSFRTADGGRTWTPAPLQEF
jgi:hypothetical protein